MSRRAQSAEGRGQKEHGLLRSALCALRSETFRAFLAHEATTQLRSVRFRLTAIAYIALAAAPAIVVAVVASRADYVVGPATFAAALALFQPALTSFFAGALSVDAISREREENAFAVVSLTPMSAAGYVLRRWLAIVVMAAPVTMVPQIAGAALAVSAQGSASGLTPFAWTWLLNVLPVLLAMSAMMLSLGTITGRTVLAILAFGAIFTFGLGMFQDLLALAHRKMDGPGQLLAFDDRSVLELIWTIRGYWSFPVASESGWPVESALDTMLPPALMAGAAAFALLAIAPAFLRRTKRDIRPWRIREDHPLRTFLRAINRVREEYALDAGRQPADVAALFLGVLLAGGALTALLARESHYIDLAAQRFAAENATEPRAMSMSIVVRSARVEGELGREVRTRSTFVIENRGTRPESHVAFALHPALAVHSANCAITRAWERVGVTLDPPLAPGATRTLTFDVTGTPDAIDFALAGAGSFGNLYNVYRRAKRSVELSDLSRSRIVPAAARDRMLLSASDFMPVPRYTRWDIPEAVLPPTRLETNLRMNLDAADSCGNIGRALNHRCTIPLATYTIAAARMRVLPLTGTTMLLHLERHEALARTHAPALGEALRMAERAWPGIIAARGVFFERPTEPGERVPYRDESAGIRSSGLLHLVPETMFIRRTPMQPGTIAASMVSSALQSRRAVAPDEQWFFARFYEEAARARLGGESRSAVVSRKMRPATDPLLQIGHNFASQARLRAVVADLEYRVGADRLAGGIDDFVAMPGEGNGRQLVDAIAKRAGVDLDRFYLDFFAGESLPQLTLENVQFARTADGWEARGALRNEGTGEVFCPIVLRTEHGSLRRDIRIGSAEAIPFVIPTPYAPRMLQLDPDRICYRVAGVGLVESVEYRGGS